MAIGLLLVRLVFGGLMAAHGSQKLFGWLGGYGLTGTGTFFEQLGFRPGRLFAAAAGIEVPLLYAASAVALAFTGPGRYSLDALFGLTSMWTTANAGIALGLAALGAIANLAARQSAVPSSVHA